MILPVICKSVGGGAAGLWCDEQGDAASMSLVLIATIVAIGTVVGLVTLRDQLVQEFGDLALALENLNQSYTTDNSTFTDPGPFPEDPEGEEPACIDLSVEAAPEGN